MNIRTRITLLFFSIVIVVLTAVSLSIFLLSSNYRQEDFFRRLKNRAINTAKILVEVKEVNAELLRRIEQNNPASLPNQYIVIYDSTYKILYSSENQQVVPVDAMLFSNIYRQAEISFVFKDLEAIGFTFKDGRSTYVIIAAATDVYGNDALVNLRNTLIVTFFISIGLVSIIGWFYAGRVLRPISRLVKEVGEITEENLSRRLDVGNGQDELGKLANTFNRILERLQNAFVAQKTFIANASHEVKTPITVMAGEIEVTLLHDRDKNYYIKILRSVLHGLRGLNRLSTQLLVLAQTSSDNPQKNNALLRIDDVLWDAKEESARFHADYAISIQLDLHSNDESLSVYGDHQLLKIAFMNLIDNGCKYSGNNKVNVDLKVTSEASIQIAFSNSGSVIPKEAAEKIFDPFFRSTEPGKKVQGFGIGLSLAKRIIELHNGNICLQTSQNQLTTFIVTLPVQVRKIF